MTYLVCQLFSLLGSTAKKKRHVLCAICLLGSYACCIYQPYDQSMYVPEEITLFQCSFACALKRSLHGLPLTKNFLEINYISLDFMLIFFGH